MIKVHLFMDISGVVGSEQAKKRRMFQILNSSSQKIYHTKIVDFSPVLLRSSLKRHVLDAFVAPLQCQQNASQSERQRLSRAPNAKGAFELADGDFGLFHLPQRGEQE
jgi:hypothetical protein